VTDQCDVRYQCASCGQWTRALQGGGGIYLTPNRDRAIIYAVCTPCAQEAARSEAHHADMLERIECRIAPATGTA